MTYFRAEENESPFDLENPEYRTKLVENFKGVFFSNLVRNHRAKYGLSWVGETSTDELLSLLEALPNGFQYNDFDLTRFVDALRYVGIDELYFGRESSVVAYIPNLTDENALRLRRLTKPDEFNEEEPGLYRFWWD